MEIVDNIEVERQKMAKWVMRRAWKRMIKLLRAIFRAHISVYVEAV